MFCVFLYDYCGNRNGDKEIKLDAHGILGVWTLLVFRKWREIVKPFVSFFLYGYLPFWMML
jgi:hypothetical protein